MIDLYKTNEIKKQRLIILNENEATICNNITEIKIKNILINLKRNPFIFKYNIYNKKNNNEYIKLIEDKIIIDTFDDIWVTKEYNYFTIKRNSIQSIYINIIYKNNFYNEEIKEGDYYIKYSINDSLYSNYLRSIDILHNLTNVEGYIKIIILTRDNINNCIIYNKKDYTTTYLYNIVNVENINIYNIKPIENKTKIKGDFTLKILNEKNEYIKYNYIYLYEYDIENLF